MNDLSGSKRSILDNDGSCKRPMGILDVIEIYYPERFDLLADNYSNMEGLFTQEEWMDILTRSRESHESCLKKMKKLL